MRICLSASANAATSSRPASTWSTYPFCTVIQSRVSDEVESSSQRKGSTMVS